MPRSALLDAARDQVTATLAALDAQLGALDAAQASETKSSAGDKFETGRERIQQERDRLGAQRAVAREHLTRLTLAERTPVGKTVGVGATVTLVSGECYLVAAAVGKLQLEGGRTAYAISPESPLARALWGRGVGEEVAFRGRHLVLAQLGR